jgi:hypothetical protein
VRNNQVEMDRTRGIASGERLTIAIVARHFTLRLELVHGNRAKEDQILIEKKKKEAEEFARKEVGFHAQV